jgi:hypothetical protein
MNITADVGRNLPRVVTSSGGCTTDIGTIQWTLTDFPGLVRLLLWNTV